MIIIITDFFRKNKNDGARKQEEQITFYIKTSTSSKTPKLDRNIYPWDGFTTKNLFYGSVDLDNRVSENVQNVRLSHKLHDERWN